MENELNLESTTSTEEATVQEATAESEGAEVTTPETEGNAEAESTNNAEGEATVVPEMFKLRYKHEDVDVPMEEARRLAQMGKHYEENVQKAFDMLGKEGLERLDYVATIQGKSVKELVESLVNGVDSAYREELEAELGADNPLISEMLELRRSKNDKTYEKAKAEREVREKQAEEEAQKSVTSRLAEQFESLRELFPEYDVIEKVPDAVIKKAIKSGDLEKEMLRYQLAERNKIEAAKASQEKNIKENIGSVASDKTEDGIASAFLKGVWG